MYFLAIPFAEMRTSTRTHAWNIIQCSSIRKIVSKLRWHINYCIHAGVRTKRVKIHFYNEIRTRKTVMRPNALWFHLFELLIFSTANNILSSTLFSLERHACFSKWFKFFRFFHEHPENLCDLFRVRQTKNYIELYMDGLRFCGWFYFLFYFYLICDCQSSDSFFQNFRSNKPYLFSGNQLCTLCLVGICLCHLVLFVCRNWHQLAFSHVSFVAFRHRFVGISMVSYISTPIVCCATVVPICINNTDYKLENDVSFRVHNKHYNFDVI